MNWFRRCSRWCAAGVVAIGLATAVSAAPVEVDLSLWTTLMPELKNAPTPARVKPGLQIAYNYATATVRGSYLTYSPDPKGNYVDPQGNTYSASDTPTGSAHGITVATVMAVDGNLVISSVENSIYSVGGPLVPTLHSSVVAYGGANDSWINPEVLPKLFALNGHGDGFHVARGPFKLDGTTYQAVWFTTRIGHASQYCIIDEATGLILRSGSATECAPPAVVGPGSGGPSTLLTITSYLGSRKNPVSWEGSRPAAWADTFRTLNYRGAITSMIQGTPTGMNLAQQSSMTVARSGEGWVEMVVNGKMQNVMGLPPTDFSDKAIVSAVGSMGAYIPPAALQKLREGEELDKNPYTKYVYSVVGQYRGPNGPMIVLREAGQLHTLDVGYDLQTGTMVLYNKEDRSTMVGATTSKVWLTGKE